MFGRRSRCRGVCRMSGWSGVSVRGVRLWIGRVIAVMCDVLHGDCLAVLRTLPDESVDAVVTDPPYGLFGGTNGHSEAAKALAEWAKGNWDHSPNIKTGYMESDWDKFVPSPELWAECLRVLKPGGHAAV